jgi:hypothetical protein
MAGGLAVPLFLVVILIVGIFLIAWIGGLQGAAGVAPPWQTGRIAGAGGSAAGSAGGGIASVEGSTGDAVQNADALDREIDLDGCGDHVAEKHGAAVAILEGLKSGTISCRVYLGPECATANDGFFSDGQRAYLVCDGVGPEAKPFGVVPLRYDAARGMWVAMSAYYSGREYVERALMRDQCEIVEGIIDFQEVIRDGGEE